MCRTMQKLIILVLFIQSTLCVLPEDDNSCFNQCFHQSHNACPPRNPDQPCNCRLLPNCKGAAICCDVNKFTLREGIMCGNLTIHTKALHIRNATFDVLDLSDNQFKQLWTGLQYLSITDGKITNITGHFSKQTQIHCLNLSSNSLQGVGDKKDRTLSNLFSLNYLDVSNNNLTDIPNFKKDGNITLNISNNKNIKCNDSLRALLLERSEELSFVNENETFCIHVDVFTGWLNKSINTIPFQLWRKMVEVGLAKNCIVNCTCTIYRIVQNPQQTPYFEVVVDCAAKNFWSLPVPLPDNTIRLNISNNNISSLREFSHPSYHSLRLFIADNNQITSMQPLEGTEFFSTFDGLSLANNKIRVFEQYILDNIPLDRIKAKMIWLGGNKIYCDCNTIKLKNWLLSQPKSVPDSYEISCENINVRVLELDATKLCQSSSDWTDYIYFIITGELLLLVLLIVKVSYDYWVFKTAGYLPWPASKMPRLPCDWLCE